MNVTFYGTRGSCPTPGLSTLKYGGNTACVLVESNSGSKLILDAGTGIRVLGDKLIKNKDDIFILLSHNHYDHIQGFPFFKPLYQKNRNINIYPSETTPNQPRAIVEQIHGSYFPVEEAQLSANICINSPKWHSPHLMINSFKVQRRAINHPNGGSAFLIESDGQRLAYVTDNEIMSPSSSTTKEQWLNFLLDVDLIIHDGQYIESDMPLKHGWGHSLIGDTIELAKQCNTKTLAIYSHDPERTDNDLDNWQQSVNNMDLNFDIYFAKEQQIIQV